LSLEVYFILCNALSFLNPVVRCELSKPKGFPWAILSDKEVSRQEDDAFGVHTAFAKLLVQIAQEAPTPFTVGICGTWGSGKTSVIRILNGLLTTRPDHDLSLIYLDVWKYSSDPLKRWVLIETERQLTALGLIDKDYVFEDRSLQSHLEFDEQLEDKSTIKIEFRNIGLVLLFATLVTIVALAGWIFVPTTNRFRELVTLIAGAVIASTGALGMLAVVGKKAAEFISGMIFKRSTRHTTARAAFSSEKFSQIFKNLVARATSGESNRRLIFVFDNLDRCPADVAIEVISVVKTFLDEPQCVYVVPCDEDAIAAHIRSRFERKPDGVSSDEQTNQFLAKFFQMTLRLPAAADFAVEEYVDKELTAAKMSDLTTDARDVLVLGYRGETPRQVKRVLNDLIGFRALAHKIEEEGLVDVGSLTSDLGHLTKMAVLSAKWPSFMKMLAEDPIRWTDFMQKIRQKRSVDDYDLPEDLKQFLWRTRLVSPDADVRPWLYLRKGAIERDAAFHSRVQDMLQTGSEESLFQLIDDASVADRRGEILTIVVATLRRWIWNHRRVLLRNGAPLALKFALKNALADTDLVNTVLDSIDYLSTNATTEEMEELFSVADLARISEHAPSWQREKFLKPFMSLFLDRFPRTDERFQVWKQIVETGPSFAAADRAAMRGDIATRFAHTGKGQDEVMEVLNFVLEDMAARSWCVSEPLLKQLAETIQFDSSPKDANRIFVLTSLRSLQRRTSLSALVTNIATFADPNRGSGIDDLAKNALKALFAYEAKLINLADTTKLTSNLLQLATRTNPPERSWWTAALCHISPILADDDRAKLSVVLKSLLVDVDPNETIKIVNGMASLGSQVSLWDISEVVTTLQTQPSLYKARYGVNAASNRKNVLEALDSSAVLRHPEIFDATLAWDIAIYVELASTALAEGRVGVDEISSRTEAFCSRYLPAALATNRDLFNALVAMADKTPAVLSAGLSDLIASCEIEDVLGGDVEAFAKFTKFREKLPTDRQVEHTKRLVNALTDMPKPRLRLLTLLVTDLCRPESSAIRNPQLLKDLADFAFAAAREHGAEFTDTLSSVVNLLTDQQQQASLDRALDYLQSMEFNAADITKMEPFLRLVADQSGRISGNSLVEATRFVTRMLGAAKPESQKLSMLKALPTLGPAVFENVRSEVEAIANGTESDTSAAAKSLLDGQSGGRIED
jgi:hypothetical protein